MGLALGFLGMVAISPAPVAALEENLELSWLFNLRGPIGAPREVVIIAIDEQSTQMLGLPDKPRDWPRNLHAQLVRYLAKAGARVISFDLTFDTPGSHAANDRELAAAISLAGNVLIADSVRKEVIQVQGNTGESIGSMLIEKPIPPIAMFEQAALGHAPFLLPKGSRVHSYWTFRDGAGDAPTLPVLALHVFASEAFAELLDLMRKAAPHASLPATTDASERATYESRLGALRAVRNLLLAHPEIRALTLEQLRDIPDSELSLERKRLIASTLKLCASSEISYLNFYGPPRSIETVSYFRVLEAAQSGDASVPNGVETGVFRNKAVFIGFSAATEAGQAGLRDDYRTVYSRSGGHDISGVEIAATAFANVLEGRQLTPLASHWQLVVVGVWGLLLGLICRLMRPIQAVGVVSVLCTVFLCVVYYQFVDAYAWWPSIVPVGVQMPLALFAGLWLNDRDSQRDRESIKHAFGQFLPSTVVDQLARNVGPITTGNRVVFGACLSTDAERYTTLAEETEPGALGALMNRYYAKLFVPVERSGGVIIDVVGDAMVAIWAGAKSDAGLRANACLAALEISAALDQAGSRAATGHLLPTRLGLHAGQMLIGTVGASHHFEYRAVGDIVNTASRIQGLNKVLGTRLLASAAAVDGLDQFATRELGSFLLAGKSTPVSIIEIVGRKEDVDPRQAGLCRAFSDALDLFRSGRLRESADGFAEILRTTPDDGPACFYSAHCERLAQESPDPKWTPMIRINVK